MSQVHVAGVQRMVKMHHRCSCTTHAFSAILQHVNSKPLPIELDGAHCLENLQKIFEADKNVVCESP